MIWDILWYGLHFLYVPSCLGLIVIVLLQKGKGTGFAGAFGTGGGNDAVFGPRSSQSLPVRMTYIMATVVMSVALILSLIAGRVGKGVAPELEDVGDGTVAATASGLDDLGIGTKSVDADRATPAPVLAPAVTTPITIAPEAATVGAVETAPATPTEAAPVETAPEAAVPPAEQPAPEAEGAPAPSGETTPQ